MFIICGALLVISSDKTEVWHQQTKRQNKESQKLVERQEHRIKRVCQKLDARVEGQFLKTKSICKRLARKADKSKIRGRATETKFLKAITGSYVFFFFIGGQKELRITRLNAP